VDYYGILNFTSEPFSNSPDPDCFYESDQHIKCLQNLELEVRLRRGLNVVIGDVGTGKTTICRQIIRKFVKDKGVETCLLLDPYFSEPIEFLRAVGEALGIDSNTPDRAEWQLREEIKNYLFKKGVTDNKLLVLIIDEGQKLPDFCIEMLREFLNYETNDYKLLQIIIFAQKEFYRILKDHPGLADRVNFSYDLQPMNFADTRAMIRYRLDIASEYGDSAKSVHFTFPALCAIYRATGGYPRKIIGLCHQIMIALIVQNRSKARWPLVRSCIRRRKADERPGRIAWVTGIAVMVIVIFFGFEFGYERYVGTLKHPSSNEAQSTLSPGESEVLKEAQGNGGIKPLGTFTVPERVSMETPFAVKESLSIEDSSASSSFPEEEIVPIARCPEILGKLQIERNGTICKIAQTVYGRDCTPGTIALIGKANPHIKNLNWVVPGETVNFPALPSDFCPATEWICWVSVAQRDSLGDIYRLYKNYPEQALPVQIFPYWNDREGLKFEVILKKSFADEESAQVAIGELPRIISSGARVITQWDEDTVFFSNVASYK